MPAPSTEIKTALLCGGVSPTSLVSNDGDSSLQTNHSSSKAREGHRTWEWPFVFSTSHFIAKFVLHKVNSKLFYCRWRWILILAVCSSIRFITSDIPIWASSLWSSSARLLVLALDTCRDPFAGHGEMLAHKTHLRHLLWTEHKPRRTVLAVCKADLHFWSRESHPKCVLGIFVVCNKISVWQREQFKPAAPHSP